MCLGSKKSPIFATSMKKKDNHIQNLIAEGEHQMLDFKFEISDSKRIARSLAAFANTDGGRLLIGVRDDGHLSGVRSEEEIYMMHQAAYKFCKPEASIKFDTYHVEARTIVIATVPPSANRPVCALDEEGCKRAYIRINDENIVASPVHLALWREQQKPQGAVMTYDDTVRQLLNAIEGQRTLNQIVRASKLSRPKVITLLARLIRFGIVRWEYKSQQFLFSQI
jgi:predicted HTH transcriptional regulator